MGAADSVVRPHVNIGPDFLQGRAVDAALVGPNHNGLGHVLQQHHRVRAMEEQQSKRTPTIRV
jgi:hypothetical protein